MFFRNSAISDVGIKSLFGAVAKIESLKIVNLEFYMYNKP